VNPCRDEEEWSEEEDQNEEKVRRTKITLTYAKEIAQKQETQYHAVRRPDAGYKSIIRSVLNTAPQDDERDRVNEAMRDYV